MHIRARLTVLIALAATPSGLPAQSIVFPERSPLAAAIPVRAEGLDAGALVTLRAEATDAGGQAWASSAAFVADNAGTVDTGRDPARAGSWEGIAAGGLFNRMSAVGDLAGRLRFQTADLEEIDIRLTLEDAAGRRLDELRVRRTIIDPNVRRMVVDGARFRGNLFRPPGDDVVPGILVLGGSEGGYADGLAGQLASEGYAALSLAYFGVDGLPSELAEIPLEYFGDALAWLGRQPGVAADRIGIVGVSKGAEATLLVASHLGGVRAAVAYAPSSVAWSCLCAEETLPSWTLEGRPLPSVGPGSDPEYVRAEGEPRRPTVDFLWRLERADADAEIPVEAIDAPILLVAGGEDQLWPSLPMAQAVMRRRSDRGGHPGDTLLSYEGAGHLIGKAYLPSGSTLIARGRIETGGTPAGNAVAQADAWPKVVAFLAEHLGG